MTEKYYLQIGIRYHFDIEGEGEQYKNKIINSQVFETVEECMNLGNKIIIQNNWIEQYPGYIGQRLNKKFGLPGSRFSFKNGAEVFINVKRLNIADFDYMNTELNKFNINKITKEL